MSPMTVKGPLLTKSIEPDGYSSIGARGIPEGRLAGAAVAQTGLCTLIG